MMWASKNDFLGCAYRDEHSWAPCMSSLNDQFPTKWRADVMSNKVGVEHQPALVVKKNLANINQIK